MLLCGLALALAARAQVPSAAQIQAFKSLPPDQQQAILQKFGIGGGAGQQTVVTTGAAAAPAGAQAAGASAANAAAAMPAPLEAIPRFAPLDSLIIDIAVRDPNAPATLPGASGGAAAGGAPQPAAAQAAQAAVAQAAAQQAAPPRTPAMQLAVTTYRDGVLKGNPYRLSPTGVLTLPGGLQIPLAGLDVDEATKRLNADPELADYTIAVTRLPVQQPLQPFGYDLFKQAANGMAAPQEGPVPADYVLGPGDSVSVQLVGENGGQYLLEVNRDGAINLPDTGPLVVAGLRFPEARALIEHRVKTQRIGLTASVSMGALRTISVFVLGDVEQPGSYPLSGLATVTTALYAAGGVKPIGSLRNVQLRRHGALVKRLDLYDLLLNGDSSNDARLLPGDVVFVPPVGITASIDGEVRRPAIYELQEGAQASELLFLAGGLTPEGDPRTAYIERIDERRDRTVVDLDLTQPAGRQLKLQTGDALRIGPIRDAFENTVRVEGHVYRPHSLAWHPGMRLSELVPSEAELKPLADTHYLLIRRETGPERTLSVVSADLAGALADRGGAADLPLESRDVVTVFDLATSRERFMGPLLDDLKRQGSAAAPQAMVSVDGSVKVPGRYPLETRMKVSDLLRAGGGYGDSAYVQQAELTRYAIVDGERRQTEVRTIDLRRVAAGDADADVALQPYDHLLVRQMPDWTEQETVVLNGEVRFPGTYPIRKGETLRSVIERAGGLTDLAFPAGSVFTREDLREREQQQLGRLADRLQAEIAALTLQQAQSVQTAMTTSEAGAAGQSLLVELRQTKAVGRLVIDLPAVLHAAPGSAADIVLKDGDTLTIPRRTQEVTVIGEVQNATSHLYQPGLSRQQYVELSGGTTQRADRKRIYVVRANGSVATARRGFLHSGEAAIQPGDTVVVPMDPEKMRPLPMWQAITQVLYNIAIAAAAVHSL